MKARVRGYPRHYHREAHLNIGAVCGDVLPIHIVSLHGSDVQIAFQRLRFTPFFSRESTAPSTLSLSA